MAGNQEEKYRSFVEDDLIGNYLVTPKGHIELNNFMTIPIFDDDKIIAI